MTIGSDSRKGRNRLLQRPRGMSAKLHHACHHRLLLNPHYLYHHRHHHNQSCRVNQPPSSQSPSINHNQISLNQVLNRPGFRKVVSGIVDLVPEIQLLQETDTRLEMPLNRIKSKERIEMHGIRVSSLPAVVWSTRSLTILTLYSAWGSVLGLGARS